MLMAQRRGLEEKNQLNSKRSQCYGLAPPAAKCLLTNRHFAMLKYGTFGKTTQQIEMQNYKKTSTKIVQIT